MRMRTAAWLVVSGNSASHGWGTAGQNGAQVTLTADAQILSGAIEVDSISTLQLTLQNGSSFTGTVNVTENAQGGTAVADNAVVRVGSGCTWTLTGNCTVTALTNNGTINYNGYTTLPWRTARCCSNAPPRNRKDDYHDKNHARPAAAVAWDDAQCRPCMIFGMAAGNDSPQPAGGRRRDLPADRGWGVNGLVLRAGRQRRICCASVGAIPQDWPQKTRKNAINGDKSPLQQEKWWLQRAFCAEKQKNLAFPAGSPYNKTA